MDNNIKYCLVTGASEGFGKALALECASRNFNLVLVALPGRELFDLADFIRRNYPVDVVAMPFDLCLEENCSRLFEAVSALGLSVNMLINNAGLGSTMLFGEGSISFYQKQVRLNVVATTLLTRLFLDMLKTNSPSYILNVGSLSSFFFLAKKQVYGATKSFIYSFSKSLRCELRADDVHVSVICPGGMNTNSSVMLLIKSANLISRLSVLDPEVVAATAISGLLNHREVIISGRLNKLFLIINNLLPGFIKRMITGRQMKNLQSVTAIEARESQLGLMKQLKLLAG